MNDSTKLFTLDSLSKDMIEREGIRATLRHKYEETIKDLSMRQKYFCTSYADFLEKSLIDILHTPSEANHE